MKLTQIATAPKAGDLEVVASLIEEEGRTFLELRDRVVSTGNVGRGILIPLDAARALIDAIIQDEDFQHA